MSFGAYLLGVLGLIAVGVALALAAVRLRARALPGWEGAPARLVEAVLGVSLLTVLLQLLGAVGILGPITLVVGALAVGAGAWWAVPRPDRVDAEPPPSPPIPRLHLALALLAALFLATHWATGLQDVWGRGMLTFDSVWYHGPFSARIAAEGSAWPLHFTDPLYLNWFYPQNSELQHAAGIALLDRDLISPLLNFAWLGLALLAAWCIGRPYGVAPLSLVAVAVILDTGPMVPREAGTLANDIAPIALLLTAAAILINATARATSRATAVPPTAQVLVVTGLAAGLALGTKMTIAGAVAALAVGVAFLVPRELRLRAFGLFVAGVAITAGFWFLRNLIHAGSPIPWIDEAGPVDLPGPGRGLEGRDPFSVSHYVFENPSGDVWRSYFFEGTQNLLGPGWFLMIGGAAAGALAALVRPRIPAIRVLGVVTVAAAVAYVFTPLTAAGPDGQPAAFTINFRYALAAFALGLALLPLWRPVGAERLRIPLAGRELRGEPLRLALLVAGLALLPITAKYSDSAYIWEDSVRSPFASIPWAVVIAVAMIGAPLVLAALARRSAPIAAAAGAALLVAVAAVGWERHDDYLDSRYGRSDAFRFQIDDAVRWTQDNTGGDRIAVAGTSGGYSQYGFYRSELDNHVQFVGQEGPGGDFRGFEKCAGFRRAINRGEYDYVVTTPGLDLNAPVFASATPERGWLATDPGAVEIFRSGRVSVYRLRHLLSPAACLEQPPKREP